MAGQTKILWSLILDGMNSSLIVEKKVQSKPLKFAMPCVDGDKDGEQISSKYHASHATCKVQGMNMKWLSDDTLFWILF